MAGWSGGVFTRARNWVSDHSGAINPQDTLFDQEDNNFAAGLNNCVTKDGTNKPSATMDWNAQRLTALADATAATDALNRQFADARYGQIVAGTFTITFTGMAGATTGTATYYKVGNLVMLYLPTLTGTSNSTAFTATGLPAAIQPATLNNQNVPIMGLVDSNIAVATTTSSQSAQLQSGSGTVTFLKLGTSVGWTASGNKGSNGGTFSYLVT